MVSRARIDKVFAGWRRLRARPALGLLVDVLAIAAVMLAIHAWQTRDLPDVQPFPARPLISLDGSSVQSPVESGEVGVVYFFAPWCNVCRSSIGNLDQLVADGKVSWASAVALDYADRAAVAEFVSHTGISLPVLLGDRQDASDWAIKAFPTYFVIDPEGRIAGRSVGYSTELGLRFRIWSAGWGYRM